MSLASVGPSGASLGSAGITLHFLHICFIGFSNVNVFQIPRRYYIYLLLTTKLMMIVVYMAKMIALTATIYTDPLSSSRHSEFIQNNGAK